MFTLHETCKAGYPVVGFDSFECYDLTRIAEFCTERVYSPILWCGNSRHESKFIAAYWCVLDFDEGVTKETAALWFSEYRYLLAPTKSDGKEKAGAKPKPACDRFRVILPFSRLIADLDIFRWNMRRAIRQFHSDAAAEDGARIWQPSISVTHVKPEGKALDVDMSIPVEETREYQREKMADIKARRLEMNQLPRRVLRFLAGDIEPGKRNDELLYACCCLFEFGWTVEEVRKFVKRIPEMAGHEKIESTIKSAARKTGAAYF